MTETGKARKSLTLSELGTVVGLNPAMTQFVKVTFTGYQPERAMEDLYVWISKAASANHAPPASSPASHLPPPSSLALSAPAPASAAPFEAAVTVHVCFEARAEGLAATLFDSLLATSYPIQVSPTRDIRSEVGSTSSKVLKSVAVHCGAAEVEKFLRERLKVVYSAMGEAVMFGMSFLLGSLQSLNDDGYIRTLEKWIGAPVAVTAGTDVPKENPKVWYGCDPNDISGYHAEVTKRANMAMQGWRFVYAQPRHFDAIKPKVFQHVLPRGEISYEAPWLHIKPNDGQDSTARILTSTVSALISHRSDLARKASPSSVRPPRPRPPQGVSPADSSAMSSELVVLGQVCLGGRVKNSLKRCYLHAASLCGLSWRGGSAREEREACMACLYLAHKAGAAALAKPSRLHCLEDVVKAYLLTVYPNTKVAKGGQEIVETCKRVLALEVEIVERLEWKVATAYGDWIWWKALEAEGGAGELSQPILNARMVATSGQVASWQGGRFVAGLDPRELAVAAYAMYQFDPAKVAAVSSALLEGGSDAAAEAFGQIPKAVEAMTNEKYKDHFFVKKLIEQRVTENPLRGLVGAGGSAKRAPPVKAFISGVDTDFGPVARTLGLVAVKPGYGGGRIEVTGGRGAVNIFVEKVNRALAVEKPNGMRASVERWEALGEGQALAAVDEESAGCCVIKVEDVTSVNPEFYVSKSCEFPVDILKSAGLGWASYSSMGLENVSSLLDFPAFAESGENNEVERKKIIDQVLGRAGTGTLNLLRLPGRKLSEKEQVKLSAMRCLGRVGLSPAVLSEVQMLEWLEASEGDTSGSFVQMKGLVWGEEEEVVPKSEDQENRGGGGSEDGGEIDVFNLIDFSDDEDKEEEDADDLFDYELGLVMGAGKGNGGDAEAGAASALTTKKNGGEQVKKSKRKNHAADPGHMYHLVTSEEWILSLRGLKTLFTRKKSKGYEPPMKLPVSYVRSLLRDLLKIASGCHTIGCVLGKAGNFKEYFGLDTFLIDETGKTKLSSVSACSPWDRRDRDVTGLRAWDALSSEERKKSKGRKIGADKLKYAAPEILLGSQRITPASDLWAIGALVLNLAAGKNLFVVNEKEPSASATLYEISKVRSVQQQQDPSQLLHLFFPVLRLASRSALYSLVAACWYYQRDGQELRKGQEDAQVQAL